MIKLLSILVFNFSENFQLRNKRYSTVYQYMQNMLNWKQFFFSRNFQFLYCLKIRTSYRWFSYSGANNSHCIFMELSIFKKSLFIFTFRVIANAFISMLCPKSRANINPGSWWLFSLKAEQEKINECNFSIIQLSVVSVFLYASNTHVKW